MREQTDFGNKQSMDEGQTRNMEVLGTSKKGFENEVQIAVPETQNFAALLFIEQYISLRSEIGKRVEIRQQILALTLLVAGTFLTVGVQPNVPEVVLLFYPIIALFLGALWEHNDLRVGQINFYIRTEVEKRLNEFGPGWETFRINMFSAHRKRSKSAKAKPTSLLSSQTRLIVFATRGMFFTTQAMALIVVLVRYIVDFLQQGFIINATYSRQFASGIATFILFSSDVMILIYTFYVVQHKRI